MSPQCVYCEESNPEVTCMATCANKCEVMAHPSCFAKRFTMNVYRKKHRSRDNDESEVCPMGRCNAKLKPLKKKSATNEGDDDAKTKKKNRKSTQPFSRADQETFCDDTTLCGHILRDGRPCTRKAGQCRLHANEANVKETMLQRMKEKEEEEEDLSLLISPLLLPEPMKVENPSRSMAVQTTHGSIAKTVTAACQATSMVATKECQTDDAMETLQHENLVLKRRLGMHEQHNLELEKELILLHKEMEARQSQVAQLEQEVDELRAKVFEKPDITSNAATAARRKAFADVIKVIQRMQLA